MQAFVPKNRKPRFEFTLRIIDLNNVPLVSGTALVKWRLPSSSVAENHGHTDKCVILDHRASWNYEKTQQVRLTVDRNQALQECEILLEVIQEFSAGAHGEKNLLGRVKLNLAEYVDKSDDDDGIVRRYLMQDSKINSTLKMGISMRQLDGDRNFTTPLLRSAMVFAGIAGVVSSEQGESHDLGRIPSINAKSNEVSDMQDMYRRTLAASWNSRAGDTPADKLIEDLFSGNSFKTTGVQFASSRVETPREEISDVSSNDTDSRRTRSGNGLSPSLERPQRSSPSSSLRESDRGPDFPSSVGHVSKDSVEQLYEDVKGKGWKHRRPGRELTEFNIREDLRSWEVSTRE